MAEIYTGEGLVRHAQSALGLKTKYMWGGLLRPITEGYIGILRSIYGTTAGTGYTPSRWAQLTELAGKGYYGVDCVGLIKSYYWSGKPDGGTGSPNYGKAGYPDVNAGMMYGAAKVKGAINSLPERPGVIVYSKTHPHVGIYIGDGRTIESTLGSRGDGVVERKLDGLWEYWFECPYIRYTETVSASLKKCITAFPAVVREKPKLSSRRLGKYTPGSTVTIIPGSETKDTISGYSYVRIAGEREAWIVKSAVSRAG